MNPKEKAQSLYNKFLELSPDAVEIDKECIKKFALFTVDESLGIFSDLHSKFVVMDVIKGKVEDTATYLYFLEVKKQIELL
jgi:hypothetical protein